MMAEKPNLHQRLAAVMGEVTYVKKTNVKDLKYSVVSHDAVTAKARPALLRHGIVYYPVRCAHTQNGNRAECSMTVRFVNIDAPSDFFEVETFGYGVDSQDKGPGKAMSYAVKYALLKALGLETGDDPDMDNIDHQTQDPALPDPVEIAAISLGSAATMEALAAIWRELPKEVRGNKRAEAAKDRRKEQLTQGKAA